MKKSVFIILLVLFASFFSTHQVNANYSQLVDTDSWQVEWESSSSFNRMGLYLGSNMYGTTTGFSFLNIETVGDNISGAGNIYQCDTNISVSTLMSNLESQLIGDACTGGVQIAGLSFNMIHPHSGELSFSYSGVADLDISKYTYLVIDGVNTNKEFIFYGNDQNTPITLIDFTEISGDPLEPAWILYGSGSPTPIPTRIETVYTPGQTGGRFAMTSSSTVTFHFDYWNAIPNVIEAYAEVRDITAGLSYTPVSVAPLSSGLVDYEEQMELTAGNLHMWRPVLDLGTSTPDIVGTWITFDVVTPSAGFTPDPEFWQNADPWTISATGTLASASTTCAGIDSGALEIVCKTVNWLFVPPPFAYTFMNNLVSDFYNAFPFNLILIAKDIVFDLNSFDWDSYDPEEVDVMTLDFTNATSTAPLGEINLLSKSSLDNALPDSFKETIRNFLEVGIYLSFIIILVMGVHKQFEK